MAEYIPGAGSLGYGFDVYGQYSDNSKKLPLFNMVYDGKQTFNNYLVPQNVNVDAVRYTYGTSTYVDERKKIEEFFASKLTVSAKYGFFSGQVEASFSMSDKSDVSYQFGIYVSYNQLYTMDLKDRSENALADWVKNDLDYKNIPDQFTDDNRLLFFRFFDKYGIYYMPRVVCGSRLYYSSMNKKEYKYTSQEAKAKLDLEYKAIFSASAEAQASWQKVGETWSSQREVKVEAVGGSNEMLNVLMPGYGANHDIVYQTWLKSAEQKPAVIDFELRPVSEIFSAQKAQAVAAAIEAYVRHKLFLESKTGSCLIAFNGEAILPPPANDSKMLGYQLAAISRSDLKTAFRRSYGTFDYWRYESVYDQMLADIQPYNNPNYLIAFAAFTNFSQNAPTKPFADFLQSCGAGYELAHWLDTKESNKGIYSCCALCHVNYVFAGIPGSAWGTQPEKYRRAGSCDTNSDPWYAQNAWLDKPAPMASLIVDLYLVKKSSDTELLEIGQGRHG